MNYSIRRRLEQKIYNRDKAENAELVEEVTNFINQKLPGLNDAQLASAYCECITVVQNKHKIEELKKKAELAKEAKKMRTCDLCGIESDKILFGCASCRKYRYCSKECQRTHWPDHKYECRILSRERLMHLGEIIMNKSRSIDEFLKFYTKKRLESIIDAGCEALSLVHIIRIDCKADQCNYSQTKQLDKKVQYLYEIARKEEKKKKKRNKKYDIRKQEHMKLGFENVCLEILQTSSSEF